MGISKDLTILEDSEDIIMCDGFVSINKGCEVGNGAYVWGDEAKKS